MVTCSQFLRHFVSLKKVLILLVGLFAGFDVSARTASENELSKEREALMALYEMTDGEHWSNNENWGSNKPVEEWYGVSVRQGYVSELSLSNNNLRGNLPEAIGDLSHLKWLQLGWNYLTGEVPERIGELEELWYIELRECRLLTGELPESMRNLKKLTHLLLGNTGLGGDLPEWIGDLELLEQLELSGSHFSGNIPDSYKNLKNVWDFNLQACFEISGTIPEWIGEITTIKRLMLSENKLSGEIPPTIGNLLNLEDLWLGRNELTGNVPETFAKLDNLKTLNLSENNLDGTIPVEVTTSKMWSNAFKSLEQNEGHSLTVKGIYESTDYSHDGDVKVLQTHSKGRGIPLVLTGTAYTDRLIADGTFQKVMDKAYESYFSIEPLTSFKDYFDVYQLTIVSKNEYIGGTDVAFGTDYDLFLDYCTPDDNIIDRLKKIEGFQDRIDDVSVILVAHDQNYQGSYLNSRFEGKAYNVTYLADRGLDNKEGGFENRIHHEACGHGMGKLADEYFYHNNTTYPESEHANLDKEHEMGWSYNLDYHNTPETVLWKDFLSNPDYDVENLGLYEGGFVGYDFGLFRPSDDSVMNSTVNQADYFNAPSRWAIYMHIMRLAGEACTFEDFLEYDKKNIGKQNDCDLNGDGIVNVADIVEKVNRIKNTSTSHSKQDEVDIEAIVETIMFAK